MLPVVDSTSVSHMIMGLLYKNSPYTVNDIYPFTLGCSLAPQKSKRESYLMQYRLEFY